MYSQCCRGVITKQKIDIRVIIVVFTFFSVCWERTRGCVNIVLCMSVQLRVCLLYNCKKKTLGFQRKFSEIRYVSLVFICLVCQGHTREESCYTYGIMFTIVL